MPEWYNYLRFFEFPLAWPTPIFTGIKGNESQPICIRYKSYIIYAYKV